jgi:hypothetical protein
MTLCKVGARGCGLSLVIEAYARPERWGSGKTLRVVDWWTRDGLNLCKLRKSNKYSKLTEGLV